MAKTNFTKVEESLIEGLRKMDVNRLLEITEHGANAEQLQFGKQLLLAMQYVLKSLKQRGLDPYKKLGIEKKELDKMLENAGTLKPEDWNRIKEIKVKVDQFKQEMDLKFPVSTDDQVVESERIKHVNKRFNVNDEWLPL